MPMLVSTRKVLAAGQVEIVAVPAGFSTVTMSDPVKLSLELNVFTPITMCRSVSPSFGKSGKVAPKFRKYRHQSAAPPPLGEPDLLKPKPTKFEVALTTTSAA